MGSRKALACVFSTFECFEGPKLRIISSKKSQKIENNLRVERAHHVWPFLSCLGSLQCSSGQASPTHPLSCLLNHIVSAHPSIPAQRTQLRCHPSLQPKEVASPATPLLPPKLNRSRTRKRTFSVSLSRLSSSPMPSRSASTLSQPTSRHVFFRYATCPCSTGHSRISLWLKLRRSSSSQPDTRTRSRSILRHLQLDTRSPRSLSLPLQTRSRSAM